MDSDKRALCVDEDTCSATVKRSCVSDTRDGDDATTTSSVPAAGQPDQIDRRDGADTAAATASVPAAVKYDQIDRRNISVYIVRSMRDDDASPDRVLWLSNYNYTRWSDPQFHRDFERLWEACSWPVLYDDALAIACRFAKDGNYWTEGMTPYTAIDGSKYPTRYCVLKARHLEK